MSLRLDWRRSWIVGPGVVATALGEGTAVTVRLPVVAIQKSLPLQTSAEIIPLRPASGDTGA